MPSVRPSPAHPWIPGPIGHSFHVHGWCVRSFLPNKREEEETEKKTTNDESRPVKNHTHTKEKDSGPGSPHKKNCIHP